MADYQGDSRPRLTGPFQGETPPKVQRTQGKMRNLKTSTGPGLTEDGRFTTPASPGHAEPKGTPVPDPNSQSGPVNLGHGRNPGSRTGTD
jgi:hypothetical protein